MRLNRSLASLGLLMASSTVHAQTFLLTDETRILAREYLDCVNAEAMNLNGAGETVSETVNLAKVACARFENPIAFAVIRDVQDATKTSPPEQQINVIKKVRESLYEQVTQEAKLALTRARVADRK